MSYAYLASAYSDPSPIVREARYQAALSATASLLQKYVWTFSPIVHCHELAIAHALPYEFEFWERYSRAMLAAANRLIILRSDGWEASTGIAAERAYAEENHIPWEYL